MGTLISTAGGFINLPITAPPGWPSNLIWPGSSAANGAGTMTFTDADLVKALVWVANVANGLLSGGSATPVPVTFLQLLKAWLTIWANSSAQASQQFQVSQQIAALTPPVPPVMTVT